MLVGVRFQDGRALVKEVALFLKGGSSIRMYLRKGVLYRGGLSAFLFVPEKLNRRYSKIRILIFNDSHIYFTTGIHRKMVSNGWC